MNIFDNAQLVNQPHMVEMVAHSLGYGRGLLLSFLDRQRGQLLVRTNQADSNPARPAVHAVSRMSFRSDSRRPVSGADAAVLFGAGIPCRRNSTKLPK